MEAEFWHERWQRREIGFHRADVHPFLARFFPALKLPAGSPVLVPLCGKSLDLLWLCEQDYRVTGVELSQQAIEEFCHENRLSPQITTSGSWQCYQLDQLTLYAADFFTLDRQQLGPIAAVYDRAALVALPAEMRSGYAAQLLGLLACGAELLTISYDYPQAQMSGPPFSVPESEMRRLFEPRCQVQKLHSEDVFSKHRKMQAAGLRQLNEEVYRLTLG
jgi:thiopurine S-methyltransferase